MRRPWIFFLILLALPCLPGSLSAQTDDGSDEAPAPDVTLGYWEAAILGLVEGITEYLPISSTGHLILTNQWLGLDTEATLLDATGNIILDEDGQPYTLARAANAYVIIIQGGAILAVMLLYWRRLLGIVRGFLGRDRDGRRLGLNLLAAFLPAVVLGLLLDDWIEAKLFGTLPILVALVAGSGLMLWAESYRRGRESFHSREVDTLTLSQALFIGLLQCVAMWPGTSRSMMTIVGGYLVGLRPAAAAEFSFLLGLITLSAASGYKAVSEGPQLLSVLEIGPVLFGCFVALVSALLAVKWLVSYLARHGLALFAYYRLLLALVIGLGLWLG